MVKYKSFEEVKEKTKNARKCCRKCWSEDTGLYASSLGTALINPLGMPFMVCKTCGNKRCPKATDCALECTNSNESGQEGSIYG
ncbi:MAG TPA: hypothetical protein PLP33_25220 [Leptospiraceae bacterium]|nr:hypothetical protein [Leptospiraceae bacterium]